MSKITAEGIIGKYKGTPVYKVTLPEYVNNRLYKDEERMFLIDGDIIYKNEIFAKFDGKYVSELDIHLRSTFYRIPEIKIQNRGVEWTADSLEADIAKTAKTETKNPLPIGNFKPEDVETTLAGVYDKDYFSGMTDIDAFLQSNLES